MVREGGEAGTRRSSVDLGIMYAQGQSVERDYSKPREWYEKAAKQGLANAQNNLGIIYDQGHGVGQATPRRGAGTRRRRSREMQMPSAI